MTEKEKRYTYWTPPRDPEKPAAKERPGNYQCCIVGCARQAVEFAAQDVPYCERHAASNRQSTRQYMSRMNGF